MAQRNYVTPAQQRSLRACMVCSVVQTSSRFFNEGCPNCEEFMHLEGSQDAISEYTSSVFEGLITMADPKGSWVAKWQRLEGYVPGVYAVKVVGNLSPEALQSVEDAGVKYIPRDGSSTDDTEE